MLLFIIIGHLQRCNFYYIMGEIVMNRSTRKFDLFSLIIGLFSLYVGYLIVKHPLTGLLSIVVVIGIFSIIRGIYQLYFAYQVLRWFNRRTGWLIFSGIIDLLLGILFLFNLPIGLTTLIYILAFWFIIDGIAECSLASVYRLFGKSYYWLIIILAVLAIIAGVVLLFRPMLGALVIVIMAAVYFFMSGILEIVEAF